MFQEFLEYFLFGKEPSFVEHGGGIFIYDGKPFIDVSGTLDFSSVERNPQVYAIRREKDAIPP